MSTLTMPRTLPRRRPLPQPLGPLLRDLVLWYAFDEGAGDMLYDLSGQGNHGQLVNGPVWVPTSQGPGVLFDSAQSQYVSVASPKGIPIGDDPYCIVVKFKADSATGFYGLAGWGNYGNNYQVNAFRMLDAGFGLGPGFLNYWWATDLSVAKTWDPDTWHTVMAQYDQTTRRIIFDGESIASDSPVDHAVPNANNLTIAVTNGTEYFNGTMAAAVIFRRALVASEYLQVTDLLRS